MRKEVEEAKDRKKDEIKTILNFYDKTADASLKGPYAAAHYSSLYHQYFLPQVKGFVEAERKFFPICIPKDDFDSCLEHTFLEGIKIACFNVGGEFRLCLSQILNTILNDFSLSQIYKKCDELYIYFSRSNNYQLLQLKKFGILPHSVPTCVLITKTDSERLCNALLRPSSPPAPSANAFSGKRADFKVFHTCFDRCYGGVFLHAYTSPKAKCVQCLACRNTFCPCDFVAHFHKSSKKYLKHWGFDRKHWRKYLFLDKGVESGEMLELFEQFKNKYKAFKDEETVSVKQSTTSIQSYFKKQKLSQSHSPLISRFPEIFKQTNERHSPSHKSPFLPPPSLFDASSKIISEDYRTLSNTSCLSWSSIPLDVGMLGRKVGTGELSFEDYCRYFYYQYYPYFSLYPDLPQIGDEQQEDASFLKSTEKVTSPIPQNFNTSSFLRNSNILHAKKDQQRIPKISTNSSKCQNIYSRCFLEIFQKIYQLEKTIKSEVELSLQNKLLSHLNDVKSNLTFLLETNKTQDKNFGE